MTLREPTRVEIAKQIVRATVGLRMINNWKLWTGQSPLKWRKLWHPMLIERESEKRTLAYVENLD
jgi:hypothetical protein